MGSGSPKGMLPHVSYASELHGGSVLQLTYGEVVQCWLDADIGLGSAATNRSMNDRRHWGRGMDSKYPTPVDMQETMPLYSDLTMVYWKLLHHTLPYRPMNYTVV